MKRVVVTSSSAAILNPLKHEKVYDESKWAPFTWDDAVSNPQFGYPASKVSPRVRSLDFAVMPQKARWKPDTH